MNLQHTGKMSEVSIGRLHPELRDAVLASNLWFGAVGGSVLLALTVLNNPNSDMTHPGFWILCVLQVLMFAFAIWRKAPLQAKTATLSVFTMTWCLMVLAYIGSGSLVSLLLAYFTLMGGFIYGTRGLVACLLAILGLYSITAYGWYIHFLPLKGSYDANMHYPRFWIDVFISILLGIGLIVGVVNLLMRRMSQYFKEEARMLRSLAEEQQLRAQAEVKHLRSELAKREAEQTLATMLRAAPIGFTHTRDRRILQVNKGLCDMLGFAEEELINRPTRDLFAEEEEYLSIGHVLAGLSKERVLKREVAIRTKSRGRIQVLLTASLLNPQNPELGLVVTALDVSDSRAAQNALQESEVRLREIFDHANDIIYSVRITDGGDYVFDRINKAAERYGFDLATVQMGKARVRDFFPEAVAVAIEAAYAECIYRRSPLNLEQDVPLPMGVFRFRTTLVPVLSIDGHRVVRIIGLSHDVTAESKVAELQNAKLAADAANRAKSAFLSNMSHEIRTPLNAVLGFTRLLLRDSQLENKQREFLGIVDRNGEHLLNLINDILEISKIEAARIELRMEEFSPAELGRDLVATFQPKADAKSVRLELNLSPELPALVSADQGKLRQILLNLVGNALKFTDRGAVTVNIAPVAHGSEVKLELSVQDTGVGISEQDAERLFQSFEQTDMGRRAGGTGLGLAISRNYARLMQGDITFTSTLGVGSTFLVTIPVKVFHQSAPTGQGPVEHPLRFRLKHTGREVRILIVDDYEDSRKLLKNMLGEVGFSTREASDGAEALAVTDAWKPHCLLMDLKMPVMDGLTALRHLRGKYTAAELKVIILSASVFMEENDQYLKEGADAFLPKPIREKEIFDALQGLLGVEFAAFESPAGTLQLPPAVSGGVSAGLARGLIEATDEADFGRLQALVAELRQLDTAAAGLVEEQLTRFDYEAIRNFARLYLEK